MSTTILKFMKEENEKARETRELELIRTAYITQQPKQTYIQPQPKPTLKPTLKQTKPRSCCLPFFTM